MFTKILIGLVLCSIIFLLFLSAVLADGEHTVLDGEPDLSEV